MCTFKRQETIATVKKTNERFCLERVMGGIFGVTPLTSFNGYCKSDNYIRESFKVTRVFFYNFVIDVFFLVLYLC